MSTEDKPIVVPGMVRIEDSLMTLGEINTILGFTLNDEYVERVLKIRHHDRDPLNVERRWKRSDFYTILDMIASRMMVLKVYEASNQRNGVRVASPAPPSEFEDSEL